MNTHLHVVCPSCNATNRVLQDKLDAGARCGTCKQPLLPSHPYDLDATGFERHVASNDLPLVVDFWAPWCGPCRMMAPAYEQAAAQLAPAVRLAKLNTEQVPDPAARLGIRGIPTLIAFKNGREVARQSGVMDAPSLIRWITANVNR
jgi:thioredoxin 2